MARGRRLGPYRFIRKLGQGGFSRTYLVEHTMLRCPAVIKQPLDRGDVSRRLLEEEARLLYRLHHWALPSVKDVLVGEDGELLIVMSYVEGDQLMEYTDENGPLELETCCWIAQRLLAALHYLHYSGVVHRDVKPANIIVDWDTHNAVLVDFGLAVNRPSGPPDVVGYTERFGAPEQIAGMPAIPESDVYALGMSLIHLLGGDLTTKTLPAEVPGPLRDFLQAMVRRNPRRRPGRCEELNAQLSELRTELFGRAHSR